MTDHDTADDDLSFTALRQEQQARRARELAELFADRAELRGVYAMADLVRDQTTWCA